MAFIKFMQQITCLYYPITGVDIAYIANGYVYHTAYDKPEYIPPGCLQRAGKQNNRLTILEYSTFALTYFYIVKEYLYVLCN